MHILIYRVSCVDFHIVRAKAMRFKVVQALSGTSVAPQPFPTFYLRGRRMNAHPEHVERGEHSFQFVRPSLLLHDVFNEQVKASAGK